MKGVTERNWRGVPQYICDACGFDTFAEDAMEAHISLPHPKRPKTPKEARK